MTSDQEFQKKLLETYRLEAAEICQAMAQSLLSMEQSQGDKYQTHLEVLFRSAHSLKGAARAVSQPETELVCQELESVLAEARRQGRVFTTEEHDGLQAAVAATARIVGGDPTGTYDDVAAALSEIGVQESPAVSPDPAEPEIEPEAEAAPESEGDKVETPVTETIAPETIRIPVMRLEKLMTSAEELLLVKQLCARMVDRATDLDRSIRREAPGSTSAVQAAEIRKEIEDAAETTAAVVDEVQRELRDALIVPIRTLLQSYGLVARNLSRELGKRVEIIVEDSGVEMDKRVVDSIGEGLVHVVRNCVDHGIELPEERLRAGKPEHGTIRLAATQRQSGRVSLEISDDGAGVNLESLRDRLQRTNKKRADEDDLISSVFDPNVTTRESVTMLSGRGMGLAIVRERVESLGGHVAISSTPGEGTVITIDLPTHFARYQGVLVKEAGRSFLLPTTGIIRVFATGDSVVQSVGNTLSVVTNHAVLKVLRLSDVLGIPWIAFPTENRSAAIVVLASGNRRAAYIVDEVVRDIEILVRSLGAHLARLRHMSGAAVTADGEIVPVLNVLDLVDSAGDHRGVVVDDTANQARPLVDRRVLTPPRVLVVEDSVTSRMLLRNILEAAGYLISTAKDGVEALQILTDEKFDVVVSDVDMPRMNGFVLVEKIRKSPGLSELPVILVTALESEEDRSRGMRAGANAYLTKGGFDQAELIRTIARLS